MSIDDRLLNQNSGAEQAADKAGNLREAQRDGSDPLDASVGSSRSLRETILEKQRQIALETKKAEYLSLAGGASAAAAPIQKGTSRLLRQSWLNLIDSFGLTLIWINIHVFLRYVIGEKFFCKLGREWADLLPGGGQAAPLLKDWADKSGKSIGTVEMIVFAICDLLLFLLIIAIISLVAMIVGVMDNPLSFFYEALKLIAGSLWEEISK
ncbi:MAG: hypothetical protein WC456_00410 [Patescibacteria group bacterium]